MKYCIVRRVAYRPHGTTKLRWAELLCESQGLALLLIPKADIEGSHSILLARENVSERVFEPLSQHRFDLEALEIKEIGDKLRHLGSSLWEAEFRQRLNQENDWP